MGQTDEATKQITIDIGRGPVTPDFDGGSRGWQADLIVDPERRRVWVYASIGQGMPAPLWHGRWRSYRLDPRVSGASVRDLVRENLALIGKIMDMYQGAVWDGRNQVGSWGDESDEDALERLDDDLESALQDAGLPTYYPAGDFFWPARKEIAAEAIAALARGEESYEEFLDAQIEAAAGEGSMLDYDDADRAVRAIVADVQSEGQ